MSPSGSGTRRLASGRAKLLLFGEHAILYGYPALGLGLDRKLQVLLEERPDTARDPGGDLPGLRLAVAPGLRPALEKVISSICASWRRAIPVGRLSVRSDIPSGSGFGSSAALCVALARLLAPPGIADNDPAIWEVAHAAEKVFHGTPSGIDTALSADGGVLAFLPRADALPEKAALAGPPLHLVYGSLPRVANARSSIARLGILMRERDSRTAGLMAALGTCAQTAIDWFRAADTADSGGRLEDLAELANQAQLHLSGLGLSTPLLDAMLASGLEAGALSGKLSGAGAGGAFWLLARDAESAGQVAQSLRSLARKNKVPGQGHVTQLVL